MAHQWITAPNGLRYRGRPHEAMPETAEGPYIAALARQTRGLCEVVLPLGRADVACESTVFEVEPAAGWRSGIRQVLAYASQTGWPPALALFGQADYERIYLFLRDRLTGVKLALWVWRGRWEHTTSRTQAKVKHAPLIDPAAQAAAAASGHRAAESKWHREVRAEHPDLDEETAHQMAMARRREHYLCLAARARAARVELGQIRGDLP